jgi:5'-nucleotidase
MGEKLITLTDEQRIMPTILLTNDDGIMSVGLRVLMESLGGLGDIIAVAPDSPRSATGMSLTFHKPLRMSEVTVNGVVAHAISGSPADCVSLGISKVLSGKRPDIVVSGINMGDNVTAQTVFASGTVAAAIQAAIIGIPSIAFSMEVPEGEHSTEEQEPRMETAAARAFPIADLVVRRGLPKGVDFLNVNFPYDVRADTPFKVTRLGTQKYEDYVVERVDPRGRPYYWQWGNSRDPKEFEPGTDAHAVFVERAISITPLQIDPSRGVSQKAIADYLGSG